MNIIKRISILTALVAVMFAFNACEEDTVGPGEPVPTNVTELKANSADDNTVHLMWKSPSDLDATLFQDYTIAYYPKGTGASNAPKMTTTDAGMPFAVTALDKDKEYTFVVTTNYTDGQTSTGASITWAPAMRFELIAASPIKVYIHTSNFGSGITLFDDLFEEPEVATVANIALWNLGLDTKTSGEINFGSASSTTYTGANNAGNSAMVTNALISANGLSDVYDSQGLDGKSFALQTVTLNGIVPETGKSGFVMYAKTGTGATAHYAKLFIKYNTAGNSVLFGTDEDKYIEVTISYQKNAGFPYAKK